MKCICVDPPHVHLVWPEVSHWIAKAYEYPSDETFEQTERDVLSGHALLWITDSAAAVSKIWRLNTRKLCTVLAVGGEADNWPELLRPIEQYAEREGCAALRLEGRHGWARVFKDYQQPWIVLEKRF